MSLQTGIFTDLCASEGKLLAAEREKQRSSLENPQTPLSFPAEWLLDIFNGGRTDSGIRVSELTALQVITLLSGVDLIAGKIASLPVHVYERQVSPNGRTAHRVAYEHDSYDLIHSEPNDEMSRMTMLKAFLCHCLVWGNGYAEIQRDAGNLPVGLWPRNPSKTRPIRLTSSVTLDPAPWRPFPVTIPAGRLCFQTTDGMEDQDGSSVDARKSRAQRFIPLEDMLHVPGLALDGRLGQSTVWLARQTLGLALATEKFGAKYFANFAKPGGILELPVNMKEPEKENAKRSWREAQGGENSHGVAVMPPGFKFTPMSHNAQEAQTIETRSYIRTEIATLLHLPVRLVGDTSTKTRGSSEQENQELIDLCFDPWMTQIKQEWKRKLFPHKGIGRVPKNNFFVDFDLTEMRRPDAATREKFYASGRQWAYLNTNDIRGFEKLAPIDEPWAEEYWMPVNMTLVGTPIDPTHQDGAGNGVVPADPAEGALARAYSRPFRDAFQRVLSREPRDTRALTQCFGPIFFAAREMWGASAQREMRSTAEPGQESERFVAEYLGSMTQRAGSWTADNAEEVAHQELARALRSIRIAVYREMAAEKAKEPVVIS